MDGLVIVGRSPNLQVNVVHGGRGFRNSLPVFTHAFQVKFDGLSDVAFDLFDGPSSCHASWKIGDINREVLRAPFDHNSVFLTASPAIRLGSECSSECGMEIVIQMPWNGDASRLDRMLVLPMAAFRLHMPPAVTLHGLD